MTEESKHQPQAYLDTFTMITVLLHEEISREASFHLTCGREKISLKRISEQWIDGTLIFYMTAEKALDIGKEYLIYGPGFSSVPLKLGSVVRTAEFEKRFSCSGELGSLYTKDKTVFKVWSPVSTEMNVLLWKGGKGMPLTLPMKRNDKGVWSAEALGDCHGDAYLFSGRVNHKTVLAVDPYARSVTANGEKGLVVCLDHTHPAGWEDHNRPAPISKTDSVIYELQVRDFSSHPESGMKNKRKFLAFCESGTKTPGNIETGLDYLKNLGVTHVQLLPVADFGSVDERNPGESYNWGYDPENYNSPEGSYSTDPDDPAARIRELKQAVLALHESGIRVILDVVFNHVYIRENSSFEKLVPGYYFRFDQGGRPSNGTGVGNDTASERSMMRKYIIDSLSYWQKEYKVDGFRFDLMGIHDKETMKRAAKKLLQEDTSIFLLGEGWEMNTLLEPSEKASIRAAKELPQYSFFNDSFRDAVKGSVFFPDKYGFISGNFRQLASVLNGSCGGGGLFVDASQSINFVECHDNHTLYDWLSILHPHEEESKRLKRQQIALVLTVFSQGVPFIHAGQEFYRTKHGFENSYCSPDEINWLDWKRRDRFYQDLKTFIELLSIRKAQPCFRFMAPEEIGACTALIEDGSTGVVLYRVTNRKPKNKEEWQEALLLINARDTEAEVKVPIEGAPWLKAAGTLPVKEVSEQSILMEPLSYAILYKPSGV
ncbi:type I pullulanase [Fictibacillus aquaticus]|uniref:Type I pullulanase n=1 Tax=Fictibacillus aquaticus TaxID=2021314 RepID=A0A235FBC6_9BACL|nr:type I pullulanase [Fictibacillus aquaticus]OYD58257.1 type I pullulanase [Fictibacillus aquaticus]